jgi:hypothetical protein
VAKLCASIACIVWPLLAQTQQPPGSISGIVRSDSSGQPLRRAQVLLVPVESGGPSPVETTDETGKFSFPTVAPGSYSITVRRDGYLTQTAGHIGTYKMPPLFELQPGQDIGSFEFRMVPWGILSGRIKFDDAEPAVGVAVQVYREYYLRGRHGWTAAATTRTDDRGEYRIHGLEPGSYYVAALYQNPPLPPNAVQQRQTDASGKPVRQVSYAVTFYPEAQRLTDAVAVRITGGQEVAGIDIFLTLVHTVRIRGRVLSALSGALVESPSLTLRWNDADNTASVTAPVETTIAKDHSFEISGVTPGPYVIVTGGSDEGKVLSARTSVSVGDADVDELTIVIGPQLNWKGRIVVDGDQSIELPGLTVELDPHRATAYPVRAGVDTNHEFEIPFLPQETYDVNVLKAPEDVYVEAVRVGKIDRLATGIQAQPGEKPPDLEVVLSTLGGKVLGKAVTAANSNMVATGANVLLIPDPPQGRSQAYKSTYADQYGNFLIRGVAPGTYIAIAWMDEPPCDVYNPDDLPNCRAHGAMLTVSQEALESVQLTAY